MEFLFCPKFLNNPLLVPQIDVFNAFIDLLRQTGNVTKGSGGLTNPSKYVISCALCSFCSYLKSFWRLSLCMKNEVFS